MQKRNHCCLCYWEVDISNNNKKSQNVCSHSLYPKILVSKETGVILRENFQDLNVLKGWQWYLLLDHQKPEKVLLGLNQLPNAASQSGITFRMGTNYLFWIGLNSCEAISVHLYVMAEVCLWPKTNLSLVYKI